MLPSGTVPSESAEMDSMKKSAFFCLLISAALPSTSAATVNAASL